MALTKEEREQLQKIADQLNFIIKSEGITAEILSILSGTKQATVSHIRTCKNNYKVMSLIKIMYSMGYDIVFTKQRAAVTTVADPVLMQKLINKRKYNEDAKRRQRKQPIRKGERVTTKPIGSLAALGQRAKIDGLKSKDDFLLTD